MPLLDSSVEWRWMREQIIELDHMLIETSQTEIPREESMGGKSTYIQNIQEPLGNFK